VLKLIGAIVLVGIVAAVATPWGSIDSGPQTPRAQAGASDLPMRARFAFASRDVLPDVAIESVRITDTSIFGASFSYKLTNTGDDIADLSRFTLQAWFSQDGTLDKSVDIPAGVGTFTIGLQPGASFESTGSVSSQEADVTVYRYLILEIDSAGAVQEWTLTNNTFATRRPPPDLVSGVALMWREDNVAVISWDFSGDANGIADLGFRVEVPGFGTQTMPPGVRAVQVPFGQNGTRPCVARVSAVKADGTFWPTVESNRLCQ
jgi:hypothetical protein